MRYYHPKKKMIGGKDNSVTSLILPFTNLFSIIIHIITFHKHMKMALSNSIIVHITAVYKHRKVDLLECSFTQPMAVFRYLCSQYLPPVSTSDVQN